MTEDEAKSFLIDSAFVAFPAARKFVLLNSSDPAATVAAQAKALWCIDREEAQAVLERWLTGRVAAPDADELENFALTIRKAALRNRPEKASGEAQDATGDQMRHSGAKIDSSRFMADLRRLGESLRIGEMTPQEFEQRRQQVLEEFDRAYEQEATA